jgi:hypothetical protein
MEKWAFDALARVEGLRVRPSQNLVVMIGFDNFYAANWKGSK